MKNTLFVISTFVSLFGFSQLSEDWMGHYKGELYAYSLKGDTTQYHMEMDIAPKTDSSCHFTIIYGEDSLRQERKYTLIQKSPYSLKLDEHNGIILDMTLIHGTLYSVFEVQENLLHVSYTLTDDGIVFELSSSIKGKETGGTSTAKGEEIPLVQSYFTSVYQFAHLKKSL